MHGHDAATVRQASPPTAPHLCCSDTAHSPSPALGFSLRHCPVTSARVPASKAHHGTVLQLSGGSGPHCGYVIASLQLARANLIAEQLSLRLAERFSAKCFTDLERFCFRDNFRALADVSNSEGGFLYWKEDTLIRFLALPTVPDVGPVIFQAVSNLAAFPFPSLAPAILNYEALVKVVALLTGRYKKALNNHPDIVKLLFRAFAVHERPISSGEKVNGEPERSTAEHGDTVYDSDGSEDLALNELVEQAGGSVPKELPNMRSTHIPIDNMRKLVMLLLVLSPLEENEPLADFAERFIPDSISSLRETADCVLRGFGHDAESGSGISYRTFRRALRTSMVFITPFKA